MQQSSTQSFLLVDHAWFQNITEQLLNLDQNVLADITEKLSNGSQKQRVKNMFPGFT